VLLPQTVSLDNNDATIADNGEVKAEVAGVVSPTSTPPLTTQLKVTLPTAPASIPVPANLPAGDFIWPVKGFISQGFSRWHPGIDIVSPFDTPVYAAGDGVVQAANYDSYGLGKHIVLGHASSYTTIYAHLDVMMVSVGQVVTKGTLIGKIGLTGRTTGSHLHFEIRINGSALSPLSLLH
jgi:murein DD-endopeptidase MepM/ murein hydrolase activator NlpD